MAEASTPPQAQLRPKNQITVPAEIVDALRARAGDLVQFVIHPQSGEVTLRATRVIAADQAWFWTPEWQAGEREADEDLASGRYTRSYSDEEFLASLDEAIEKNSSGEAASA